MVVHIIITLRLLPLHPGDAFVEGNWWKDEQQLSEDKNTLEQI